MSRHSSSGRGTATTALSLLPLSATLFLLGLHIHKWHRPDVWMPALAAMRPMLDELYADPDSGLLGHRMTLAAGGPLVVQYWRSADALPDVKAIHSRKMQSRCCEHLGSVGRARPRMSRIRSNLP